MHHFYVKDLRNDMDARKIQAGLEETKDQIFADWRDTYAPVLVGLRCGRLPNMPELVTAENVADDPWTYDEDEFKYMISHVQDAVDDLKQELNEAAVNARHRMLGLQLAKLKLNVAVMGAEFQAKEQEVAEEGERLIAQQLEPEVLQERARELWAPVFALKEAAQPLIEQYADALFLEKAHKRAAQLRGDYNATFLSASEEAEEHFCNPDSDQPLSEMRNDERAQMDAYPRHSQRLLDAAARSGAMVAAYDTLLNLYREMRFVQRLKQKDGWREDWPPRNRDVVDVVTRFLVSHPQWQLCNHRGRTGVEEAVQRVLVWCCGLPEADAEINQIAENAATTAPELTVWALPNRRDPDSGVVPLPCPIRARFPELPSLEAAALALMERRRALRAMRFSDNKPRQQQQRER